MTKSRHEESQEVLIKFFFLIHLPVIQLYSFCAVCSMGRKYYSKKWHHSLGQTKLTVKWNDCFTGDKFQKKMTLEFCREKCSTLYSTQFTGIPQRQRGSIAIKEVAHFLVFWCTCSLLISAVALYLKKNNVPTLIENTCLLKTAK